MARTAVLPLPLLLLRRRRRSRPSSRILLHAPVAEQAWRRRRLSSTASADGVQRPKELCFSFSGALSLGRSQHHQHTNPEKSLPLLACTHICTHAHAHTST